MTSRQRYLILNGPNLGRLGQREPEVYGKTTLADIEANLQRQAEAAGVEIACRQSDSEAELIRWIWEAADQGVSGICFNPGAFTHTSLALHDAIKGAGVPTIEVHLSHIAAREPIRQQSLTAPACTGVISGFGARSYTLALAAFMG